MKFFKTTLLLTLFFTRSSISNEVFYDSDSDTGPLTSLPSQLQRRNATNNLFNNESNNNDYNNLNLTPSFFRIYQRLTFEDEVFKSLVDQRNSLEEIYKVISQEKKLKEKRRACIKIIQCFDQILEKVHLYNCFENKNHEYEQTKLDIVKKVSFALDYFFNNGVDSLWQSKKGKNFLKFAIKNQSMWIVNFILSKVNKQIIESTLRLNSQFTLLRAFKKNIHYEYLKSICIDR